MRKILLPLLVLSLFLVCCNKTPNANPNRADYLRTGKWKISAASVKMRIPFGYDTTINYMNLIPACHQDDYITFDSLNVGSVHNGGVSCSLADADSINFVWTLTNNETVMNIYNGFTLIDSVQQAIFAYHYDTISKSPLVLDTLVNNIASTPPLVLDTLLTLQYSCVNSPSANIYNATITNFSAASFTMNFDFIAHYQHLDFFNQIPVIEPDTFHYSVTYSNF